MSIIFSFVVWYIIGLVLALYENSDKSRYIEGPDFIAACLGPIVALFILANLINQKRIRNPFSRWNK